MRDDLMPHFAGTFHVTDDPGVFANDPDVTHYATGDPAHPLLGADDDYYLARAR